MRKEYIVAIKGFNRVSGDTRGALYAWSSTAGGSFTAFWPAEYANVSSDLSNAATALGNGIAAAATSIEAADKQFKQEGVLRAAGEAASRYIGPGFRAVRQAAISERQAVQNARESLKRPIEATATPNSTMVDYLYRQEVRQQLANIPGTLGDKFAWLMASEGTDIFNAVAPYLSLTALGTDPALTEQVLTEWAIRKTMKFMSNEPNDNFSSPDDPTRVRMDDSAMRILAKGKVDQLKLRSDAVDAAIKFLKSTVDFTTQSTELTPTQSFDLLMGKSA